MNQISETQTNEQEINGEMSVFLTDSILGPAHRQGIRKEESQSRSVVGFLSMERQLFFGPLARNCRRTLLTTDKRLANSSQEILSLTHCNLLRLS